jgi:hypothetical protein
MPEESPPKRRAKIPPDMTELSAYISKDLKRRFKQACVALDRSISDVTAEVLEHWLSENCFQGQQKESLVLVETEKSAWEFKIEIYAHDFYEVSTQMAKLFYGDVLSSLEENQRKEWYKDFIFKKLSSTESRKEVLEQYRQKFDAYTLSRLEIVAQRYFQEEMRDSICAAVTKCMVPWEVISHEAIEDEALPFSKKPQAVVKDSQIVFLTEELCKQHNIHSTIDLAEKVLKIFKAGFDSFILVNSETLTAYKAPEEEEYKLRYPELQKTVKAADPLSPDSKSTAVINRVDVERLRHKQQGTKPAEETPRKVQRRRASSRLRQNVEENSL